MSDLTERRSQYTEYISAGVRFAMKETGIKQWPESTVIVVTQSTSELCNFDQIIGFPVVVSNIPTSYDFHLAFSSDEEANYKLLTAFTEYCELYEMEYND